MLHLKVLNKNKQPWPNWVPNKEHVGVMFQLFYPAKTISKKICLAEMYSCMYYWITYNVCSKTNHLKWIRNLSVCLCINFSPKIMHKMWAVKMKHTNKGRKSRIRKGKGGISGQQHNGKNQRNKNLKIIKNHEIKFIHYQILLYFQATSDFDFITVNFTSKPSTYWFLKCKA